MSTPSPLLSTQDFAAKIRAKYPGSYDSLGDEELTSRIVQKYPEYKSAVNFGLSPETRQMISDNPPNLPDRNDQGVVASLKRTGKGLVDLPGQVFSGPRNFDEELYTALQGRYMLPFKRLFVDPMVATDARSQELRQQAKLSEMEGQTSAATDLTHQANMHAIGSVVPVAGPLAASIIDRYRSGDKSGAATDLATVLFGPKIAEKTIGAIGPTVKAGVKITGKAAGAVADIVDPDIAGIISPRLAHIIRTAQKVSKIANKLSPPEQAAAQAGNSAAGLLPAESSASKTPSAVPQSSLPNATYLRDDIRSLSQQPPVKQLSQLDRANELLKGIKEHEFLSKVQDELNRPEGQPDVAAEIDARMAELAKKPWDKAGAEIAAKNQITGKASLGNPEPVEGMEGIIDYPIIKNGQRVGKARISISGGEARVGFLGPENYKAGAAPLQIGSDDALAMRTQFEAQNPGVKLKVVQGSATAERAAARVERRFNLQQLKQTLANPPKPKAMMTEGSDLIEALRQMARAKGAD